MVERASRVIAEAFADAVARFRAVYGWERRLHDLVVWATPPRLARILGLVDDIGTDERVCRILALALLPVWPVWAIAVWGAGPLEEYLKWLAGRPRPSNDGSWGLPSGDAVLSTVFYSLLGWWAAPIVVATCWARVVRQAHWPLDIIAGVAVGLLLVGGIRGL